MTLLLDRYSEFLSSSWPILAIFALFCLRGIIEELIRRWTKG